jgi:N-methylhydantoinase A/oxoprolinase/acetone carboxylase beta subunit
MQLLVRVLSAMLQLHVVQLWGTIENNNYEQQQTKIDRGLIFKFMHIPLGLNSITRFKCARSVSPLTAAIKPCGASFCRASQPTTVSNPTRMQSMARDPRSIKCF